MENNKERGKVIRAIGSACLASLVLIGILFLITWLIYGLSSTDPSIKSGNDFCNKYNMKYQVTGGYNRESWCYDSNLSHRIIETENGWRFVESK